MIRKFAFLAAALGAIVLLGAMFGEVTPEVFDRLMIGWASFLVRVVPNVRVAWGSVGLGLICLVFFSAGLHFFLRWLHGAITQQTNAEGQIRRRWSPRWTAFIVAILVVMFVAGIAATGIAHQTGWLMSGRHPLLTATLELGAPSVDHLKYIGLGVHDYASANGNVPNGVRDPSGRSLHSWQTQLIPYLSVTLGGSLEDDKPWNGPENSAYFKSVMPPFLNPKIGVLRDSEGYALSHFAGNVHILGSSKPLRFDDITAGTSNTVLAGEVAGAFRPWGDPGNLRDPALGINQEVEGFGGPSGTGANMLFLDGSVKFLSKGIRRDLPERAHK